MSSSMRISEALVDDMVAHARADDPNECCGLVSRRDGDAVGAVHGPLTHVHTLRGELLDPIVEEIAHGDIGGRREC